MSFEFNGDQCGGRALYCPRQPDLGIVLPATVLADDIGRRLWVVGRHPQNLAGRRRSEDAESRADQQREHLAPLLQSEMILADAGKNYRSNHTQRLAHGGPSYSYQTPGDDTDRLLSQ